MKFISFLRLDFLPRSADFALLVLRLWVGLSLLVLHGWTKLTGFSRMSGKFPDPLGVGSSTSLTLAVLAEVGCAILIMLGLFTRPAALVQAILMGVAFFVVHEAKLAAGPGSGELAFIYLSAFVTLFIAGPGRYALDGKS